MRRWRAFVPWSATSGERELEEAEVMEIDIAIGIHISPDASGPRRDGWHSIRETLGEEVEITPIDRAGCVEVTGSCLGYQTEPDVIPPRNVVLDRRSRPEDDSRIARRVGTFGDSRIDGVTVDKEDVQFQPIDFEAESVWNPGVDVGKHEGKLNIAQEPNPVLGDREVVKDAVGSPSGDTGGRHGAEGLRAVRDHDPFEKPSRESRHLLQVVAIEIILPENGGDPYQRSRDSGRGSRPQASDPP